MKTRFITCCTVLVVCVVGTGCDPDGFVGADKTATAARFQSHGSSCSIEVLFANSIVGSPAAVASYYTTSDGREAIAVTPLTGVHGALVTFEDRVDLSTEVVVGAGTSKERRLAVERHDGSDVVSSVVDVEIDEDAQNATFVVGFDNALDPNVAGSTARYALQGYGDHPVAVELADCGRSVILTFDGVPRDAAITVDGLVDVNGLPLSDLAGVSPIFISEGQSPTLVEAVFPSNGLSAAVDLRFSEAVDRRVAENLDNFLLSPGDIRPAAVEVVERGSTVRVYFDYIEPPVTIDASGVTDLSGSAMDAVLGMAVATSEDTVAPTPTAVVPSGHSDGVVLRVSFDEAVTLNTAGRVDHYTLIDPETLESYHPQRASVMSGGSKVDLTFDFLPRNSQLVVEGITDLSGNRLSMATPLDVDFDDDRTGPGVSVISFVQGDSSATIEVSFDEPVEEASAQRVENYRFSNGALADSAELLSDGRTVRLTGGALALLDTVSVANVADLAGNVMEAATGLPVHESSDTSAPSVLQSQFLGDRELATLRVTFSESVDRASAETVGNYISTRDGVSPVSAILDDDGKTVILSFASVSRDTSLEVRNVLDLGGNPVLTIATPAESADDSTSPQVVSLAYLPNTESPTLEIEFSEAVSKALAEAVGAYALGVNRVAARTATLQPDGHTVVAVFPPVSRSDTISISSVTDFGNNIMVPLAQEPVALAGDANAPTLLSASFSANAATPAISLVFSEAVDASSTGSLHHYESASSGRPTSVDVQTDGRTVLLLFDSLSRNENLDVSNIADFGGNIMSPVTQFPISANDETVPPTISSAIVTTPTMVTIVFSESVDKGTAETLGNYSGLPAGAIVTTAVLQNDGRTVVITTSGTALTTGNTISISGVSDLNGNIMAAVVGTTMS